MLLYIHVPFCTQKCAYCAFYSVPLRGAAGQGADAWQFLSRFPETVIKELQFQRQQHGSAEITSIFFGGGTPSLLPPSAVQAILQATTDSFAISADVEVSMEANPISALAPGWLQGVRAAGVTRLSLGVQSLDAEALRLLGRLHSADEAVQAVKAARAAGFVSLGLDLIWGVPRWASQHGAPGNVPRWLATLQAALDLEPDHISAYNLTLEQGTTLASLVATGQSLLPSESEEKEMYLEGIALMEKQGLVQYEVSNFARPGHECRHNLGYWQGLDYLGLGPSAVSCMGHVRKTNEPDLAAWDRQVTATGQADAAVEPLSPTVRLEEKLMLGLRTKKGLNLAEWEQESGISLPAPLLRALHEAGYSTSEAGHLALTPLGMLLSNSIIAALLECME